MPYLGMIRSVPATEMPTRLKWEQATTSVRRSIVPRIFAVDEAEIVTGGFLQNCEPYSFAQALLSLLETHSTNHLQRV
jgi:hypothetical protein